MCIFGIRVENVRKMNNKNLNKAKSNKKDEFTTQIVDIEKELWAYKKHFQGKTVYCNCDDYWSSNFSTFFEDNFDELGLEKLIVTGYKLDEKFSYYEKTDADDTVYPLKGDGDFRSDECIEILKQADIVVTNPPFSLFREYITQLIEYDKKFIIIGNQNAIAHKLTFDKISENKIWLGHSIHGGDREFGIPDDYEVKGNSLRTEGDDRFVSVAGVRWFTNLEHGVKPKDLELTKKYDESLYPKYDNYNAINVNITKNIPIDYEGEMGVPITFLDKYNPEQFEIIGLDRVITKNMSGKSSYFKINGLELYSRIVIKKK